MHHHLLLQPIVSSWSTLSIQKASPHSRGYSSTHYRPKKGNFEADTSLSTPIKAIFISSSSALKKGTSSLSGIHIHFKKSLLLKCGFLLSFPLTPHAFFPLTTKVMRLKNVAIKVHWHLQKSAPSSTHQTKREVDRRVFWWHMYEGLKWFFIYSPTPPQCLFGRMVGK